MVVIVDIDSVMFALLHWGDPVVSLTLEDQVTCCCI